MGDSRIGKVWKKVGKYIVLYLFLIFMYILFDKKAWNYNTKFVQVLMWMAIGVSVVGLVYWKRWKNNEKSTGDYVIWGIFALGFILRIGYCMYTPWYLRQHDVGAVKITDTGHAAYILYLFNGKLPSSNTYQFYHPPFFHFCAAVTLHIIGFLEGEPIAAKLIEGSKMVSCFATCAMLWQVKSLFQEMGLKKHALYIAMGCVAVFPYFFLASATINNDALALLFLVLAFRYTLKWYQDKSWKNLLVVALAYGFGMMTKSSCGIMAIFTALVMFYVGIRAIKAGNLVFYIKQYLLFALVSFPLGLWFAIRNYIKFGQSFHYVYKLETSLPLWCGDHSFRERFLPHFDQIFTSHIYCDAAADYNICAYAMKSALMGEYSYTDSRYAAYFLVLLGGLFFVTSLFAMIYVTLKQHSFVWVSLLVSWGLQILSFITFNVKYPFGCTMDYRYIPFTTIVASAMLAKFWEYLHVYNKNTALTMPSILSQIAEFFLSLLLVLFAMICVYFYCTLKAA